MSCSCFSSQFFRTMFSTGAILHSPPGERRQCLEIYLVIALVGDVTGIYGMLLNALSVRDSHPTVGPKCHECGDRKTLV